MNATNEERARPPSREHLIALALILLAGSWIRIAWNDVPPDGFSRADEGAYVVYTTAIASAGWATAYPALIDRFVTTPADWPFPNPARWGYLLLAQAATLISGSSDAHTLAWLSTVAGIASILLTYVLGSMLVDRETGLLAAAFTTTSPLQLHLGRRALQDEVVGALFLAAVILLLRMTREERPRARRGWLVATIATLTLAIAVKETFVLLYVPITVLLLMQPRKPARSEIAAIVALPLILDNAILDLLARRFGTWLEMIRVLSDAPAQTYTIAYQSGPPHRVIFDLFILSPLVVVLAIAALTLVVCVPSPETARVRPLAAAFVVALVIFMILPRKNVRYAIVLDPFLRMLAAWVVVHVQIRPRRLGAPTMLGVAGVNALVEIPLFVAVFLRHGLYDPVTEGILRALRMVAP